MYDQKCNLCETRVYCAEMMCTCTSTWLIKYGVKWDTVYPKTKPRKEWKKEETYKLL